MKQARREKENHYVFDWTGGERGSLNSQHTSLTQNAHFIPFGNSIERFVNVFGKWMDRTCPNTMPDRGRVKYVMRQDNGERRQLRDSFLFGPKQMFKLSLYQ